MSEWVHAAWGSLQNILRRVVKIAQGISRCKGTVSRELFLVIAARSLNADRVAAKPGGKWQRKVILAKTDDNHYYLHWFIYMQGLRHVRLFVQRGYRPQNPRAGG